MAYKFVNADQLDAGLATVADAIRTKGGTSEQLSFPTGMISAISAISTGVELNFDIKDYATEELLMAATGKVNEIGIITSTPMTGWYMEAEQPEGMQPGEVWISTGTESQVAFNALKKNSLMVYPLSAKQMGNDGALVDVTAKSWQNGKWVDWWNGEIYKDGIIYEVGCGGINPYSYKQNDSGAVPTKPTLSIADGVITLSGSGAGSLFVENPVDTSRFSKAVIHVTTVSTVPGQTQLAVVDGKTSIFAQIAVTDITSPGRFEVDLNPDWGTVYIAICFNGSEGKSVSFDYMGYEV